MKALLVIDVQNGIVNFGDFKEELSLMENVIKDFKDSNRPVIFMRHLDDTEESPLYKGSVGSELHSSLKDYADYVLEKQTPSSFFNTELSNTLEKLGVNHLFITGFNTEFCCMFTAISAFDRGYKVTFIENATGTVNTDETYEMQGLDIKDFVGTVLHWSNVIEVLDYEEYVEEYKAENTI
ncbi:isochorismatase family protein [Lederbergia citrea]|uniref:Isochorismatase family protein n=1 Tax=Lederbergia citrea TaxID=2833581 RepID=A0A942UM30_9BACI|nr:isochorismatase family protein [Lederbergia citrea]MBS4176506.1 isochorismatase family protein [Lederbergia citrea]MBS4203066.1 isochorismatase family protein [Lederbergia citrea]MBS4222262.1 isochorismatase family protein [Lederbergia citrea]